MPAARRLSETAASGTSRRRRCGSGRLPGVAVQARLVSRNRCLRRRLCCVAGQLRHLHLHISAAVGLRGRHRDRCAPGDRGRRTDPAACDRRDPGHDRGDRPGVVAARRRSTCCVFLAWRRCCDDRPGRGHRHLSRCRRSGPFDPPGRRRGAPQRCGRNCAVRRFARDDRCRSRAGYRLGAGRVLFVVCRRWPAGTARRPGADMADPLARRRPPCGRHARLWHSRMGFLLLPIVCFTCRASSRCSDRD